MLILLVVVVVMVVMVVLLMLMGLLLVVPFLVVLLLPGLLQMVLSPTVALPTPAEEAVHFLWMMQEQLQRLTQQRAHW